MLPLWIISVFLPQNNPELCAVGNTGISRLVYSAAMPAAGMSWARRPPGACLAEISGPCGLRRSRALASVDHLLERLPAGRPVDQDHRIAVKEPADDRDVEQFLLGDDAGIGKNHAERHRLPQRLVIAGDDAGADLECCRGLAPGNPAPPRISEETRCRATTIGTPREPLRCSHRMTHNRGIAGDSTSVHSTTNAIECDRSQIMQR